MKVTIGYNEASGTITGRCLIGAGDDGSPIYISERVGGVHELTRAIALRMVRAEQVRAGMNPGEIGFWGWAKKVVKKARKTAEKIAKKVKVYRTIEKVVKKAKRAVLTAKKIFESPAFAAAVGVISATVPGGAAVGAGYGATRAALLLVDKMAAGDPQALATVGNYAAEAIKGTPEGQKAMALFNSVKASTAPAVALKDNPWLKDLGKLGLNFAL